MILDKVLRLFYKAVNNIKSRWLLNRLVGSQEIIEVMLFDQITCKTENYSVEMSKVFHKVPSNLQTNFEFFFSYSSKPAAGK